MKRLKNIDNFKNKQVKVILKDDTIIGKFIEYKVSFVDSIIIEIDSNYSLEVTLDEITGIYLIGKTYTLEEIINQYSKKDLTITTQDGYSISGRIMGYEKECDSEVLDDVIFFGKEFLNYFNEIKVSDIVDIIINTNR